MLERSPYYSERLLRRQRARGGAAIAPEAGRRAVQGASRPGARPAGPRASPRPGGARLRPGAAGGGHRGLAGGGMAVERRWGRATMADAPAQELSCCFLFSFSFSFSFLSSFRPLPCVILRVPGVWPNLSEPGPAPWRARPARGAGPGVSASSSAIHLSIFYLPRRRPARGWVLVWRSLRKSRFRWGGASDGLPGKVAGPQERARGQGAGPRDQIGVLGVGGERGGEGAVTRDPGCRQARP